MNIFCSLQDSTLQYILLLVDSWQPANGPFDVSHTQTQHTHMSHTRQTSQKPGSAVSQRVGSFEMSFPPRIDLYNLRIRPRQKTQIIKK